MKGNAAIFIIIGLLAVAVMGFLFFKGFIVSEKNQTAVTSSTPQSFSDDPKYKDVKEKYNLSEEQLQILSTVNPDDNN